MGKEKSQINLQYDRQAEQAREQNAWQSAENQVDREWQAQQWMNQFQEQVQQQNEMFEKESNRWKEQFDIQNAYNAPEAQLRRLMAAGINPAALASSLGAGSSSASVGSSTGASAPSGGSPSSHGVSPIGLGPVSGVSSDAAIFSSVAQLADSAAKLGTSSISGYATAKSLESEIGNKVADTKLKDMQSAYQSTLTELKKAFGGAEISAEIQKMTADAYASYMKGDLDGAQKLYTQALEKFTNDDNARKNEAFPLVCASMRKQIQLMSSEIGLNTGRAAEAYSRVSLNNALTKTEDDLRSGRVEAQELSNQLLDIQKQLKGRENVRDAATHQDKIMAIIADCEARELIPQQTRKQIEKLMIENRWSDVEKFFGVLGSAVGSVASGASAYGNIKGVSIGERANDIREQFNNVWSRHLESQDNIAPTVVHGFGQ